MQTKLTTALAILLLAGASGAAMAQDRDHGERGQAAPQAHPQPQHQPQHAGPPPGAGGGHFGGERGGPPHVEGAPRGPVGGGPGGGHVERGGPPPGEFRGREGEPRGPQGLAGGQQRFGREAAPNAVAPRQFEGRQFEGQRGQAFAPGARYDGRPQTRPEGHAPMFGGVRGAPAHWQAGRYPPVMWAQDRFRVGSYRAPYGYYSRAWAFGDFLPRPWFASDYWLNDFLDFDLPYPPPGFMWVRVGPDALMIDRYSGRIVQVVRGIFW